MNKRCLSIRDSLITVLFAFVGDLRHNGIEQHAQAELRQVAWESDGESRVTARERSAGFFAPGL